MGIRTENLCLKYGDGDQETYALRDVSLAFADRGFFGIMGPSGSGKSSLLYLMSGLKQPSSGQIYYKETSLSHTSEAERTTIRRKEFGFVFQQPFLLNYLTAKENILVAARQDDPQVEAHVQTLLEELQIAHLASRYPPHLSGGEKQRIVVARAMINRPAIIFADEPTAALDHANGRIVIEMLLRYRTQGTVLVVTHDPAMLTDAEQVCYLTDGMVDRIEERQAIWGEE
jgi:putative ABC transport system ATP-binding protein